MRRTDREYQRGYSAALALISRSTRGWYNVPYVVLNRLLHAKWVCRGYVLPRHGPGYILTPAGEERLRFYQRLPDKNLAANIPPEGWEGWK